MNQNVMFTNIKEKEVSFLGTKSGKVQLSKECIAVILSFLTKDP